MNKPFKILSSTAMAAALATTALVPTAAAETPVDVPADAKQLSEVIFESKGQLVSLDVQDYIQAVAAGVLDAQPTHIAAADKSVYTLADYSQAVAANKTPEKALEILYSNGAYVEATVVPGKIVDKQVVAKDEAVNPEEINEKINIKVAEKIVADGVTTEVVKFQLLDKTGNVDKTANDVVLKIDSTFGFLSQQRVTVQNGEAEVILRSEFLKKPTDAKITAQVFEAKDSHKELIGKVAGVAEFQFVPAGSGQTGEEITIKKVVAANSNEADRVTLFFDEEVTMEDFYKTDDNGLVIDKETKEPKLLENIKIEQRNGQGLVKKDVRAVVLDPSTPKQATVILNKEKVVEDEETGKYERPHILEDNKDVYVEFTDTLNKGLKSNTEFKLADARVANVTSVDYIDPRTIEVKFSEPIEDATFLIDGQFDKNTFEAKSGDLEYKNGAWIDTRHIVTIELNDNYEEKDGQKGYFKPGVHALETSNIRDFAALSDPKNVGSTQVLEFEVPANNEQVVVTRTVDSPEQFRVNFNKDIKLTTDKGKTSTKVTEKNFFDLVDFQVWDPNFKDGEILGKWVSVDKYKFGGKKTLEDKYTVTQLKDSEGNLKNEFKVELTEDWTKVYDTKETKLNHFNDTFRFFIDEKKLVTASNGKVNEEEMDLRLTTINGKDTALANPDIKSPEINSILPIFTNEDAKNKNVKHFVVEMTEPVKLKGHPDSSGEPTLAEDQKDLPETKVEFHGTYTDKFGKVTPYTFPGKVLGYEPNGIDNKIQVMWEDFDTVLNINGKEVKNPQEFVNAGGSEDFKVVVKAISDDVGNVAATVNKPFTLKAHKSTPGVFQVKPNAGEAIGDNTWASATNGSNEEFAVSGEKNVSVDGKTVDQVTITYTDSVAVTGLGSATNVKNYALNGQDLPTGSTIALKSKDEDNVVVITAPAGTLTDKSNVITLAKQIESKSGETINYDLSFTFKTAQEATEADLKKLEEAILAAKQAAEASDKTPASIKKLEEAIEAAEKVADSEEPTTTDINNAIKALEKAQKDLQDKADKSKLEAAIADAEDVDLEGKTADTKEAFEKALKDAKEVKADENATQEKVDAAEKALKDAKNNLKNEGEEVVTAESLKIKVTNPAPGFSDFNLLEENLTEEQKGKEAYIVVNEKEYKFVLNEFSKEKVAYIAETPEKNITQEDVKSLKVIFR